jgi:hypothetical protein
MVHSFRASKSVEGGWASKLRVEVPGGLADSLDTYSEDSYGASLVQADMKALGPHARNVGSMLAGRRSRSGRCDPGDDPCEGGDFAGADEMWTGEAGQEALEAANAVMMETRKTIELTMKGVHERLCSEMHVNEEDLRVEVEAVGAVEPCEEAAAEARLQCMEEASMISIAENLAMQMEGLGIQRKYAEMQALDAEDIAKKQKMAKKKAGDDAAKDVHKVLGRLEEAQAKADAATKQPGIGIVEGAQGSNLDSAAPIGLGLMLAFEGKDLSSSVSAGLDELGKLQQQTRARMQHLEGMVHSCGTCVGVCNCSAGRGQDYVCPPGYTGLASAGVHSEEGGGSYRVVGRTDVGPLPKGQLVVNGGGGGPASALGVVGGGSVGAGAGVDGVPEMASAHSLMTRAADDIQRNLDCTMMDFKRHMDVEQKDAQEKKELETAKEKAKKKAEESAKNGDKEALESVEAEWADAQAKGKVPFPKLFEPAEWRAFRDCAEAAPTVEGEMGGEAGAGSMADEAAVRFDAAARVLHGCEPTAALMVGSGYKTGDGRGDPRGGHYTLPPHCRPYATDPHYPNRANGGGDVPGWVAGQAGDDWGVGLGEGWEAGQAAVRGAMARDPLSQQERQAQQQYHPHPRHPQHQHYHYQQQQLQRQERAWAAEAAAGHAMAPIFPPSCLPEHGVAGPGSRRPRYPDEPGVEGAPRGGAYDYGNDAPYSASVQGTHRAGVRARAAAEAEADAHQNPFGRGMPSTTAATPPKPRGAPNAAGNGTARAARVQRHSVPRCWSPRARQAHAQAHRRDRRDQHRQHRQRAPLTHEQRRWQQHQARADELLGSDDGSIGEMGYGQVEGYGQVQRGQPMVRGTVQGVGSAGQGGGNRARAASGGAGVGLGVQHEQMEQQGREYLSQLMDQWQQHHRLSPMTVPQPQASTHMDTPAAAPLQTQAEQQLQQLQQQLQQQQILQQQLLQFQQQIGTDGGGGVTGLGAPAAHTFPSRAPLCAPVEPHQHRHHPQPAFLQPPQPHPSDHYSLVWGNNHHPSVVPQQMPPQPQARQQPQVQVHPQASCYNGGGGGGRYGDSLVQLQSQQDTAAELRSNLDHFKELRMQRMKGLEEGTAY